MGLRIALCQTNPVVGDLEGNLSLIAKSIKQAKKEGAGLFLFPELAVVGYPPQDLLWDRRFLGRIEEAHGQLRRLVRSMHVLVGSVHIQETQNNTYELYNAAFHFHDGEVRHITKKTHLARHDVFDEARYFLPWRPDADPTERLLQNNLIQIEGKTLLVSLCRDMWNGLCEPFFLPFKDFFVPKDFSSQVDFVVNMSASPFHVGKAEERLAVAAKLARRLRCPLIHVNQVGGFDGLLFDGNSFVLNNLGEQAQQLNAFKSDFLCVDLPLSSSPKPKPTTKPTTAMESTRQALVFGVRNYVRRSGFSKVVLGLSGGIDSAVVCVLAVQALGCDQVHVVALPTSVSPATSVEDARLLAKHLKLNLEVIPMEDSYKSVQKTLGTHGDLSDLTKQNLQARLRGLVLMAMSNERRALLLNTSNKSELAMGFATLYGDLNGAFSPMGDLYKTEVYGLARWINQSSPGTIPESILNKEPSAELSPNQKDSDSLPSYPVLDAILRVLVEEVPLGGDAHQALKNLPYDKALIRNVFHTYHTNEFKRFQAPPVLRVSKKSFGSGRRMPLLKKIAPPL